MGDAFAYAPNQMETEMMEGTAAELGLDGRYLAHMKRRGEAEIIGRIRKGNNDSCIWRVLRAPTVDHPGDLFRVYRNEAGMSQCQMADELGFDQSALANIEKGKTGPSTITIYTFLDFLGVRFTEFFARLDCKESLPRLPQRDAVPLNLAIAEAINAVGVRLKGPHAYSIRQGSTLSHKTITNICNDAGLDHLKLWQQVDCRLRWTR
jgi:transcriptional regulator with XRE-family HTH domain